MGFFRRVGRQVEQFTRTAKEAAEENADYQCRACTARYHTRHDQCPKCGAREVTATTDEPTSD